MKNIKPSQHHPNRDIVNFLVYKYADYFLLKFRTYYKGTLVDLGCGEAPYKDFFLQYVDKYIGVDWTNSLHNIKADVISNLNEKIDLPDEIADVVIALSVMEHLCEPQVFLNESFRILKKGGVMILQVPFQWWVHEEPYDYFRFTPYGLKYMLEKAGFKNIEIYPTGGFFTMWFLKLNYFLARNCRNRFTVKFKIYKILDLILTPIYFSNQLIAPILDKLDRRKELETSGYWVLAKKEGN